MPASTAASAEHTSRFLIPFLRWLNPAISFHTIATIHFTLRKLGHFSEYFVLAALLWRALRATFTAVSWRLISVVTFLVAAGFAEFQPLDTATTEDAYKRNRRIELKLTER